jgi:hypothetical protein
MKAKNMDVNFFKRGGKFEHSYQKKAIVQKTTVAKSVGWT